MDRKVESCTGTQIALVPTHPVSSEISFSSQPGPTEARPHPHISPTENQKILPAAIPFLLVAVWCSGNALVSINAVALHRARLVLGWVTAFGQVNCLIR